MALSPVYLARGDSSNANNAELNVQNTNVTPVTEIQFVSSGAGGDLTLDWVADDGDVDTLPEFDPDTQVIINGTTYNFVFLKSGTLDPARTDPPFENAMAYVIKVDVNGDGDVNDSGDQQYFFTKIPGITATDIATKIQNGALALGSLDVDPPGVPVCFCAGTDISTPSGPRKVETLVAGDMVLTDAGAAKQVMWVGRTRLASSALRHNPDLRPIVIPADAMGPGLPAADLHVSPQHRIVLQGPTCELLFGTDTVLVPAKFLVGTLAEMAPVTGAVDYFHILLEDHDMLVSNGLPTESFQPARRTIDVMDDAARTTLESVISALGAEEMLTRKDQFLSLKRPEAKVLLDRLHRHMPKADGAVGAPRTVALTH